MFRGGNLQGHGGGAGGAVAASAEERLESLKRQFSPDDHEHHHHHQDGSTSGTGNGLSMHLQDQYDQHEAEQSAKRHRSGAACAAAGMMSDFNAAGANNNSFGAMGGMMAGMGFNSPGGNGMGMGIGNNSSNMGSSGFGNVNTTGGGPNGNGNIGMSMNNPTMAGNNINMNGIMANNFGMNPMANMNMNNMANMGMNMNMNMAAQAGMLGGAAGAGGFGNLNPGRDDFAAAALYFNDFQNQRMNGLLAHQRDPVGLGFAAMAQGAHFGGLLPSSAAAAGNPFGEYGRLAAAQNPYAGLAGGFPQGGTPGGATSGAMGATGATMSLPLSNDARRAHLMALVDMENEAAKVTSAGGGENPFGGGQQRRRHDPEGGNLTQNQPIQMPEPPMDIPTFCTASTPAVLPLPPIIEEGAAPHFSQRPHIPLGIDEDNNWLTEFQCFIRFDLIEVVQASRHVDQINPCKGGNSSNASSGETFQQVGIRCRYCAHLHPGQRASRSSAFPSSVRQLYQSFTMMLRDHFEQCSEIPPLRKKLFSELKAKNSQGAYDSKQYWCYAAEKLGMIDSEHGIKMTAESQAKARCKPPFGTVGSTPHTHSPPKLLVCPEDIRITSDFLYTLMSQVQVVHLIDSERVGKRKTLRVGLPGFGCRYCCHVGRCGLSRMFPLRRRMLPGKVLEIYEHFKRCTLFPTKEKNLLAKLKADDKTSPEQEKEFFDRIWERLGCESEVKK